jgi:hypothetical protein
LFYGTAVVVIIIFNFQPHNSTSLFSLSVLSSCAQAMQRDYKLSSYSLNSVSAHFLGEQVSPIILSGCSFCQHTPMRAVVLAKAMQGVTTLAPSAHY